MEFYLISDSKFTLQLYYLYTLLSIRSITCKYYKIIIVRPSSHYNLKVKSFNF